MPPRPRKRVRRRRRVQQLSSGSSSSSGSDSNSDGEKGTEAPVLGTNEDAEMKNASSDSSSSSDDSSPSKPTQSDKANASNSKDVAAEDSSSEDTDSDSDSDLEQSTAPAKRGRLAKKQRNQKSAAGETGAQPVATRRSPSPVPASPPPPLENAHFELDLSLPYLDHPPAFALPFNSSGPSKHDERLNTVTAKLAESEADFRAWYMSTVVDRFENELDHVRKELESSRGTTTQTKFDLLLAGLASGADVFEDSHHPLDPLSHSKNGTSTRLSKPSNQSEKELVMETLRMRKSGEDGDHSTRIGKSMSTEDIEMQT